MNTLKLRLAALLICSFGVIQAGCSAQPPKTSASLQSEKYRYDEQVKQSITTMVNAIDTKNWNEAIAQFSDTVYVDYSSLSGLPGSEVKATDLVNGWKKLLTKAKTHHILSNFDISVEGNQAEAYSHVYASHLAPDINYWDAYGRYHHKLQKVNDQWKITSMTLLMHGQKGNTKFLQEISQMNENTLSQQSESMTKKKVSFTSEGKKIVGHLFYPDNYDPNKKYPAVIVSGSWTTVKEQMSGLYAQKLAQQGLIALAFDFRNFGESEGQPRFYESPTEKVKDIKSAVSYLHNLNQVEASRIGALGVCAGSMYSLLAASEDKRIKSVVAIASWLHDAEAVKLFYGGETGVQEKIEAAKTAKAKYTQTGEVDYIPAISTTDSAAAMYGPYDYYLNPKRGAVPQWSADKFAVMTWQDWLTVDPMQSAEKLTTPTLMIHSDGAVLPQYAKHYFEKIGTNNKKLHWIETELESPYHQFDFYDSDEEVNESIAQAKQWFSQNL